MTTGRAPRARPPRPGAARAGARPGAGRRLTLERTYEAPIEDVWELWTTRQGLESWWGPEGFRIEVHHLELRAGGELRYDMIAVEPQMVAFMQRQWGADRHPARLIYSEVTPMQRLAYVHRADFIPGVEPYDVDTVVELHPADGTVRLVVTFDAMHDDAWTRRQAMGWELQLGKLGKVLDKSGR